MRDAIFLMTASIILGLFISWIFGPKSTTKNPGKQKNKRKEQKLLTVILKDMKENPGNWVRNGFSPQLISAPTLVNDKKNMGILYGEDKTAVTIHFNMKDVTRFDRKDTDTILTTISGKHVTKFIKEAIHLLDHRGKELEYFTERLKERL